MATNKWDSGAVKKKHEVGYSSRNYYLLAIK